MMNLTRKSRKEKTMNKVISLERIYSLGDYQNIKFTDTISEIPDAVASNPDAIKLLRYLQLVDIEWGYLSYMRLRLSEPKLGNSESVETALSFIENERTITFENLLNSIRDDKDTDIKDKE